MLRIMTISLTLIGAAPAILSAPAMACGGKTTLTMPDGHVRTIMPHCRFPQAQVAPMANRTTPTTAIGPATPNPAR